MRASQRFPSAAKNAGSGSRRSPGRPLRSRQGVAGEAADARSSSEVNAALSALATVGPTWRIERATSRRCRPRAFECRDRAQEVPRRDLAEPVERGERLLIESVEIGHLGDQAGADEELDPALSEAFDVHGRSRAEVGDALHPLRWALRVHAVGVALAF